MCLIRLGRTRLLQVASPKAVNIIEFIVTNFELLALYEEDRGRVVGNTKSAITIALNIR